MRSATAEALCKIGDAPAVPGLIEYLSDTCNPQWKDRRVCDAVAEFLERIGTPEALDAVKAWKRKRRDRKLFL